MRLSNPARCVLKLRIPHWSERTTIKLNGKVVSGVQPGRYAVVDRRWKSGDKIEISLDMSFHFWRGEQECDGLASVYCGPILLAYDNRYNLENATKTKRQRRDPKNWDPRTCMLKIPPLDVNKMRSKQLQWHDWLPPLLLLEFKAANGRTIHLCDFGSAGEVGTPYCSWLPVKHCPKATEFSRITPLRSSRPLKRKRRYLNFARKRPNSSLLNKSTLTSELHRRQ